MKVVIHQPTSEPAVTFLRECGYEVVLGNGKLDQASLMESVRGADALLIRDARYTREVLACAPDLKVIGRMGVGLDNVDLDYCRENGVWVTIAPAANSNAVAEHVMGFLVDTAHRISYLDREVRRNGWKKRETCKGRDLAGKTLGIIGPGRIGRLIAKKATLGLDMRVIGYHPRWAQAQYPEYMTPMDSRDALLAASDFVVVQVPATPETIHMVDRAFLQKMKRDAVLINCARGAVVDEAALYEALRDRVIAFAAVDVLQEEPPKGNHPFFELDNIIITPHTATLTLETMDAMGLDAAKGIDDVLSGRRPEWPAVSF